MIFRTHGLLLLVFAIVDFTMAEETYSGQYDHVDVEKILKNDRILQQYVKCLIDQGNCTPDAKELKATIPDALETECSKCSAIQKERTEKIIRFLSQNKPTEWEKLKAKFDPTGEYTKKYQSTAEKKGLKV